MNWRKVVVTARATVAYPPIEGITFLRFSVRWPHQAAIQPVEGNRCLRETVLLVRGLRPSRESQEVEASE